MNRPRCVREFRAGHPGDWAAGTMDRDYPALRAPGYGPGASGELLRGGRAALLPGGLDEMPEDARTRRGGRIVRLS